MNATAKQIIKVQGINLVIMGSMWRLFGAESLWVFVGWYGIIAVVLVGYVITQLHIKFLAKGVQASETVV